MHASVWKLKKLSSFIRQREPSLYQHPSLRFFVVVYFRYSHKTKPLRIIGFCHLENGSQARANVEQALS